MAGLKSVSDTQENEKVEPREGSDGLVISTGETEEKFKKKMGQISFHEKERDTIRFANKVGFPHIDLEKFPITHEALRQITKELAVRQKVICFYSTQDEFRLGAVDPRKEEIQELLFQIEERNHVHGAIYVISQKSFDRVLKLYETLPTVKPITKDIEIKADKLKQAQANIRDFASFENALRGANTTEIVMRVLAASLKLDASDVHVEPEEKGIAIRFRLDGILHDAANVSKDLHKQLVSRVKLVSSLKINVTDKPQDGRFTIKLPEGEVDVRVSVMPTVFGESIVMRLLRQSREGLSLDELGLCGDGYKILQREIARPNGMIITTGPTGSGKTTTMYAILQILNKPGVKIITLEDPVEYRIEGVNQSQIDRSHDYTFAKGLRSILRQDPDIAMVGEIRDLETADIAIQASLTGHLMLSTIHTNNAAGAIPRFLSMGVKPFLLAPALNVIIGQRLVRRLCDGCKIKNKPDQEQEKQLNEIISGMPEKQQNEVRNRPLEFYGPGKCDACNGLGYKGRIGVYEIFVVNNKIEEMILSGHISEYDMERSAVQDGMLTMVQDGVIKTFDGTTSLDEVFRVVE